MGTMLPLTRAHVLQGERRQSLDSFALHTSLDGWRLGGAAGACRWFSRGRAVKAVASVEATATATALATAAFLGLDSAGTGEGAPRLLRWDAGSRTQLGADADEVNAELGVVEGVRGVVARALGGGNRTLRVTRKWRRMDDGALVVVFCGVMGAADAPRIPFGSFRVATSGLVSLVVEAEFGAGVLSLVPHEQAAVWWLGPLVLATLASLVRFVKECSVPGGEWAAADLPPLPASLLQPLPPPSTQPITALAKAEQQEGEKQARPEEIPTTGGESAPFEETLGERERTDAEEAAESPLLPITTPALQATPPELNYAYDFGPSELLRIDSPNYKDAWTSVWWDRGAIPGAYKVRGPNYLSDKVKIPSSVSAMEPLDMVLRFTKEPSRHVIADPAFLAQHANRPDRPFLFVTNFVVAGWGQWIAYWAPRRRKSSLEQRDEVFDRMLREYCEGTDEYRMNRLKIIPGLPRGSFLAKQVVGNTPAIVSNKLTTTYHAGPNCFEVVVDVTSSSMASSVLKVIGPMGDSVDIELAFLLESQSQDELPERVLGGMAAHRPNLSGVSKRPVGPPPSS